MKILILSDVHGNLNALEKTFDDIEHHYRVDGCVLLGDLIDYGMHSNEVINMLQQISIPIICNIQGNHEHAIISNDFSRFSSERGRQCAQYTKEVLNDNSWNYITKVMMGSGTYEFSVDGKRCFAVHGSLEDIYWKSIKPGQDLSDYKEYDYVFSGHSHLPHFFELFYEVDAPEQRNKKKTVFINPGSVGQPRNLCPMAQFSVLDTETGNFLMKKVVYDIEKEQEAYTGQVDDFYRKRLGNGI